LKLNSAGGPPGTATTTTTTRCQHVKGFGRQHRKPQKEKEKEKKRKKNAMNRHKQDLCHSLKAK